MVVDRVNGTETTSNSTGIVLREVEKRAPISSGMRECFEHRHDHERIAHTLVSSVKRREFGVGLDYDALNDDDDPY